MFSGCVERSTRVLQDQEGDTVTSSPAGNKLPNINGLRDSNPRHSLGYRVQHRARTVVASVIVAMLVFAGTAAAATWLDVDNVIQHQKVDVIGQGSVSAEPTIIDPNSGKPIEILLLGQDSRDGEGNQAIGGDMTGNHQADTAMVLQISADRSAINLVSIPRDSLVDVPQCETSKGTIPAQYGVMFNSIFAGAYQTGGDLASAASCTLNAVNSLTGLNIQNFIVVD
ncbi:MAG: LCP family protein, partial [Bifidobacterium sp.]|nr:LCP family protein [Bifidobacterium sp.]